MTKTLVAGPPCGGKTTFARSHSDSVLDYDDLVEEFGGERYGSSIEAYGAWLARLPLHEWVVWTAPRRRDRGRFRSQWNARSIVVLASPEVCHSRAEKERPPTWHRPDRPMVRAVRAIDLAKRPDRKERPITQWLPNVAPSAGDTDQQAKDRITGVPTSTGYSPRS